MNVYVIIAALVIAIAVIIIILVSKRKRSSGAGQSSVPAPVPERTEEPDADPLSRPAEYDSARSTSQQQRVMVPDLDDEFFEEKTVASYEELTAAMLDDDDKTVPIFSDMTPVLRAVLTRCSDGEKTLCSGETFTVGKSQKSSDYRISENQKISRLHATFSLKDGEYYIVDSSKNGTSVNDIPIRSGVEIKLKDGDKITFADEEFIFNIDEH